MIRHRPHELMLDQLQRDAFTYFLAETNPVNGLVRDCTRPDFPSSIAVVGFALAAYPIGVERGFVTRSEAVARTLKVLRFFWNSPQGTEPDATGYKGFYYHFLDMGTGRRAWDCELSTIDTVLLLAGALVAALYFEGDVARSVRFANLRTPCTAVPIGNGRKTPGQRLRTGGNPKPGSCLTGGVVTMRQQFSTSSAWVRPHIRSRPKAFSRTPQRTVGRRSTTTNSCMPARFSSTNTHTCGSTSAASKTRSCAARGSTTSRTAAGPPAYSRSTRFETL